MKTRKLIYSSFILGLMAVSFIFFLPFLQSIVISFCENQFNFDFVGLANYKTVLSDHRFLKAIGNNTGFVLVSVVLSVTGSFAMALLLKDIRHGMLFKIGLIIPFVIPTPAVIGFFNNLFGTAYLDLLASDYAMIAVMMMFLWRSIGVNVLVFSVAMDKLDKAVVEASAIDGANSFNQLRYVIVPMMTRAFVLVSFISLLLSMDVFRDVELLFGKYPNTSVFMVQHYMNLLYSKFRLSELSALGVMYIAGYGMILLGLLEVDHRYTKRIGG